MTNDTPENTEYVPTAYDPQTYSEAIRAASEYISDATKHYTNQHDPNNIRAVVYMIAENTGTSGEGAFHRSMTRFMASPKTDPLVYDSLKPFAHKLGITLTPEEIAVMNTMYNFREPTELPTNPNKMAILKVAQEALHPNSNPAKFLRHSPSSEASNPSGTQNTYNYFRNLVDSEKGYDGLSPECYRLVHKTLQSLYNGYSVAPSEPSPDVTEYVKSFMKSPAYLFESKDNTVSYKASHIVDCALAEVCDRLRAPYPPELAAKEDLRAEFRKDREAQPHATRYLDEAAAAAYRRYTKKVGAPGEEDRSF